MPDSLPSIYQPTVAVVAAGPTIWWRLFTQRDASFVHLRRTPPIAFGWEDFHVHRSSESRGNAMKELENIKRYFWHGNVFETL